MKRNGRISIVKVARHRSLDNRHNYPSINKRRSNAVIHVNIRLPKSISSINNNLHSSSKNTINKSDNWINKSLPQISYFTKSSKVTDHQDVDTENYVDRQKQSCNKFSDQTGVTRDYHQKMKKKKNKCSRRCFIACLLAILLLISIVITILLVLLLKTHRITPSDTPELRWNTTGITIAGITGNPGITNNKLNFPFDIIFDYANNLYITDYLNNRVQKYLRGSSIATTIAGNGTASTSQYNLDKPSRIIIDSNGDFYITDRLNHRVLFWPNGATLGTTVAGIAGSPGNASNQLNSPYGIVLHPTSGTLYISDFLNHRIMSYAPGANNGTLVLGDNTPGMNNTQLNYPVGLYFDSFSNSLVIVNNGANNIVRYVLGATGWTLIAGNINGTFGGTSTSFYSPMEVTYDPMGNMYVADRSNRRIQFFYDGQGDGKTIAGITGVSGNNATTLDVLSSVRLDSQLNLYVADSANNRIQKFVRY